MSSGGHKKHAQLVRPQAGRFGRNEWAFTGGRCEVIKELAEKIITALGEYKCGYADAQHAKENETQILPGRLQHNATIEYVLHENYHQLNFTGPLNEFSRRSLFQSCDLVLVNGNHFEAARQVVIVDAAKKESLRKRLSQLTKIDLVLCADSSMEVFDFLQPLIPAGTPVYQISDTEKVIDFFRDEMRKQTTSLKGLVLAGGKSIRLGYDKTKADWNGREQRYYISDILYNFCTDVFISCRHENAIEIEEPYQVLTDSFTGLGPYGAILSAFRSDPNAAWLVLACDLPLMDENSLQQLVAARNVSAVATAFQSPRDGSPEPLAAIWEPRSYPLLLNFLSQGISCPRKALMNSNTQLVTPNFPEALMNVNTPEDEEEVRALMARDGRPPTMPRR